MSGEQDNEEKPMKEFIYTWRIENVNCFWQKNGEELLSPVFEIDWLQSSYNLCLYPKGVQGEETFMSYFIVEKEKKSQNIGAGATVELYLLAADGSEIHSKVAGRFLLMKKSGMLGHPRFISWESLNENKSDYIRDEIMTLCCRIGSERAAKVSVASSKVKAFGRTQIRKAEYTTQMPFRCEETGKQEIGCVGSILQTNPTASFSVTSDLVSAQKSLNVDIQAEKNERIKLATLELALLDEKREIVFWKKTFTWHGVITPTNIVVSPNYPKTSDQYTSPEMLAEKFLFLHCHLVCTNGAVIQRREEDDYGTNLKDMLAKQQNRCTGKENAPQGPTVDDALKIMHDEQLFCDVVVKARKVSFNVHEMVLCPRSSTFESMVKNKKATKLELSATQQNASATSETQQNASTASETQQNAKSTQKTQTSNLTKKNKAKTNLENQQKAVPEKLQGEKAIDEQSEKAIEETAVVIQVEEDDDTMRRVIYFLYTDVIEDMHWEVAKKLYKAAVKYKIELLKRKCYAFLKKNLAMANVFDILIFTEGIKADELKGLAKDFILQNDAEVFNSAEWKSYAKSHASIALEMMISKFKP